MPVSKKVIEEMKADLESIGQSNSLPLFPATPKEDKYKAVDGIIITNTFGNLEFHVVDSKGNPEVAYPVSGEANEGDASMNIGVFVALRDYTSRRGNEFKRGKTERRFAYAA